MDKTDAKYVKMPQYCPNDFESAVKWGVVRPIDRVRVPSIAL